MTKFNCRKRCAPPHSKGILPILSILVIALYCLLSNQHTTTFAVAEQQQQQQRLLNDVNTDYGITIDKNHYLIPEPIVYSSPRVPNDDQFLTIIRTADIETFVGINSFTQSFFSKLGDVAGTLIIDYYTMFQRFTPPFCPGPNVIQHNFTTNYGPFTVIRTDPTGSVIVEKSQSFTIGIAEEILNFNPSYYPGEHIVVNSTNTNVDLQFENPLVRDNLKVFKVPYSFKDDPLLFNTIPVFRERTLDYNGLYLINWDEPGLYQMVTFVKGPFKIVKGISNVFEVKPNDAMSRTTITLNASSFQPAQLAPITLTRLAATPYNKFIEFRFIRGDATTNNDFEYYMGKSYLPWTSNTTTMTFYPKIHFLDSGIYKLTAYLEDNYRLGTSKVFKVTKASLLTISMSKREFYQGERVSLNVFNPYFDFEKDFLNGIAGVLFGGYEYAVKSASSNNDDIVKGVDPGNFFVQSYKPGYYKFAVNRFADSNFVNFFPDKIALTISNTTFRVLNNKGKLLSDQSRYRVGEMIKLTLSTSANISLCGQFPGYIKNRNFYKYIEFTNYDYTFNSNGECVGPTSLTYETLIDWSPQGAGDTKVEVNLDTSDIAFAVRWFNVRK